MNLQRQIITARENKCERIEILNHLSRIVSMDAELHDLYGDADRAQTMEDKRRVLAGMVILQGLQLLKASDDDMHYAEELADVVLMAHSTAGYLDIDLGRAVEEKRLINMDRQARHGR